jgi:hypothetical protein
VPPDGFAVSVMPWPLATVGLAGVMEPALNGAPLMVVVGPEPTVTATCDVYASACCESITLPQ